MDGDSLVDGVVDQSSMDPGATVQPSGPCHSATRSGESSALCEQRVLLQRCLDRLQHASSEVTAD